MLALRELRAAHGPVEAVRGVTLDVGDGEVLALVGPNGAGKTTLARAVAGLHPCAGARRTQAGELRDGAVAAARAGVALVPQGRRLFGSLTVAEHLAVARRHRRPRAMAPERMLALFPQLRERLGVRARSLSGGEQQMLAIARAVLPGPDVVVLDEPTEGLAPAVVELVAGLLDELRGDGVSVLLLEQPGAFAGAAADRVMAIERGVLRGEAARV